jgi:hypothetical protein
VGGVGVLRLRHVIRFADDAAPLRMTKITMTKITNIAASLRLVRAITDTHPAMPQDQERLAEAEVCLSLVRDRQSVICDL